MQSRAADDLHIEVTQTNGAVSGLAHQGERFGQQLGERRFFGGQTRLVVVVVPVGLRGEFAPFHLLLLQTFGDFVPKSRFELGRTRFEFVVGEVFEFGSDGADLFDHRAQSGDFFLVFIEEARHGAEHSLALGIGTGDVGRRAE